jgi:hypothetical protein
MGFFTKLKMIRVLSFATQRNVFPHHIIHKCTRNSPDGKTHNQIYHVLTDKSGIQMYLMSDTLKELTVILIIIWWFRNLEAGSP